LSTAEWPKASWVLGYFGLYFTYLWLARESELWHWVSLVALPWTVLWLLARRRESGLRLREVGRRLGLAWPRSSRGMGLALALVVAVQGIQLLNHSQREEIASVFSSAEGLRIVPAAFLFGLATAGFTEEFFFRGILQRALSIRFGSQGYGILGASALFALYHVPYAYLNPSWPSAGDLPRAFLLAGTNGFAGGVILGLVFARARMSLVPCILVHAAVDWMPAIRLLAKIKIHA
jgi:membrane protease YdiL (CAAX protease family)